MSKSIIEQGEDVASRVSDYTVAADLTRQACFDY